MVIDSINKLIIDNIPNDKNLITSWGNLHGSSQALVISNTANYCKFILIIVIDNKSAFHLEKEIQSFNPNLEILIFPDWETLPYDMVSPSQEIISRRLITLYKLFSNKKGIIIVPVNALIHKIVPIDQLLKYKIQLQTGDNLSIEKVQKMIKEIGYNFSLNISKYGEFNSNNAVINIFPLGADQPFRLEFIDHKIYSINKFDLISKRKTNEKVDFIDILPAKEFLISRKFIKYFSKLWDIKFRNNNLINNSVIENLILGEDLSGIEYYLPLFFRKMSTLFDYLPKETILFFLEQTENKFPYFWEKLLYRYKNFLYKIVNRPLLPLYSIFLTPIKLKNKISQYPKVKIQSNTGTINFPINKLPNLLDINFINLKNFLEKIDGRTLITFYSHEKFELTSKIIKEYNFKYEILNSFKDFCNSKTRLALIYSNLEQGFCILSPHITIITETQIYGLKQQNSNTNNNKYLDFNRFNDNFFEVGMLVVHEDHGLGRYLGLKLINVAETENEFLVIEYADNDILYVPVSSINLISRYGLNDNVPLNKLGNNNWEKTKKKVIKQIKDTAAELLDLYSSRELKKGHNFNFIQSDYLKFSAEFPFIETPDQKITINKVISDMCSDKPMDRIICGDVGFGKTEVAMRAAFLAVRDGYQVAVLTPTTLLAQQHYQNFLERFSNWPISIGIYSRFLSKLEQENIKKTINNGQLNIIIGTHKILQNNISFKNLGLVIIDEEHRFGVKHKEYLKSLRKEVDIITMTATPIPRTLSMSLSGLRDLSIISTPPIGRLSVKTFVNQWSNSLIQEACQRELNRNGQIYFLHNNIDTIQRLSRQLSNLLPDISIRIAHGKMKAKELEKVMVDFYHHNYDLLVCTTIIESGIDIPNANTIIINRADKLGLAQLHQLRGRVGRSHQRAYAYLLIPSRELMNEDSTRRVSAIESFDSLGSGFMLADQDLEIRGAGTILGEKQSGQMREIGYPLYLNLLDKAVKELKNGETVKFSYKPEIHWKINSFIPEDYLSDINSRLSLYRRINNVYSIEKLYEIKLEIIDLFGKLPDQVNNLFLIEELKILAIPIGLKKIEISFYGTKFIFFENTQVNLDKLFSFINERKTFFKIVNNNQIFLRKNFKEIQELYEEIRNFLSYIK